MAGWNEVFFPLRVGHVIFEGGASGDDEGIVDWHVGEDNSVDDSNRMSLDGQIIGSSGFTGVTGETGGDGMTGNTWTGAMGNILVGVVWDGIDGRAADAALSG